MTRALVATLVVVILGTASPSAAQPQPPSAGPVLTKRTQGARLSDPAGVRRRLGLSPEYDRVAPSRIEALKVAVLDYGFDGMESGRGYLPEGTVVVEHYDPAFVSRFQLGDPAYQRAFEPGNRHGRQMAQIIWGVTGHRSRGPKFYLLNAGGPTLLRRAVRFAIEEKVDVILFSGSFEGGGNGDGRGPVNRIVGEAIAAGILWVNASGNHGHRIFNGPVQVLSDGYVRLRDGADVAALRFRNRVDENDVTVTLTWNDYRETEDAGTTKDLDLYVEDWAGRPIGSSTKRQVSAGATDDPTGETTRNPRERVVLAAIPASPVVPSDPDYAYRIRVRHRGGQFTRSDRLRILVDDGRGAYFAPGTDGPREALEFLDANGQEELYPPADHPQVFTVGDASPLCSVGPTADRRVKPEALIEDSRAFFTDGQTTSGSSNAAAYLAGIALVLKAAEPKLRPSDLFRLAREGASLASLEPAIRSGNRDAKAIDPGEPFRRSLRVWRTPTVERLARLVRGQN